MKKMFSTILLAAVCLAAAAQSKPQPVFPEYTFTTVKANPITSVKNQHRSGTCWVFSGIGFVESEIIRLNAIQDTLKYPDLSEFFVVSHSYLERGEKFIRLRGALGFRVGSECDDVLDVIRDHGIVPQKEMTGMNYGTELPVQAELDAVLRAYVDAVNTNPNKTLTTAWKAGLKGILDAYLGAWPAKFKVDGVEYTPKSYRDALKFKPSDYVSLTSFTHHPFYTKFPIEIPDNWRWDSSYNLPIDELMDIVDSAVNDGFTVAWAADVSQWGFTRNGMAVLLTRESGKAGSDQERWVGKEEGAPAPATIIEEIEPTQESRQVDFDNRTLTDDHGMQIYGIAKDQNGKKYYMVKNSWGTDNKYAGLWYATEAYLKGQTISITVHKDALSKELKKKLGIVK